MHQVLWTSGWDSTFRVADLVLTHGRTVQPWYVIEPGRRSTPIELRRMRQLVDVMDRLSPGARARVREPQIRNLDDLPADPQVQAASLRVGAVTPLGAQHGWLPLLAIAEGLDDLEIGWEYDYLDQRTPFDCFVRNPEPAPDDWFTLDPAKVEPDKMTLFGRFRFPIVHLTKVQMGEIAHEGGFDDVMALTWTCRWPTVFGRPCGLCMPCTETRAAGLGHRVPEPTRARRLARSGRLATERRAAILRANAGSVTRRLGGR